MSRMTILAQFSLLFQDPFLFMFKYTVAIVPRVEEADMNFNTKTDSISGRRSVWGYSMKLLHLTPPCLLPAETRH